MFRIQKALRRLGLRVVIEHAMGGGNQAGIFRFAPTFAREMRATTVPCLAHAEATAIALDHRRRRGLLGTCGERPVAGRRRVTKGVFYVARAFLPAMIQRGRGVIVNFSSDWGRSTSSEVAPYCATKWAIEGLTQSLAAELPAGMAAIPLNPGIIHTDMLDSCFGEMASSYPSPQEWAKSAAPYLLKLGARDNGRPLSAPSLDSPSRDRAAARLDSERRATFRQTNSFAAWLSHAARRQVSTTPPPR